MRKNYTFSKINNTKKNNKISNENELSEKHEDKNIKGKPKFRKGSLVRTKIYVTFFYRGDVTNWSYELYEITKTEENTLPVYYLESITERCYAVSTKQTTLTKTKKTK